MALEFPNVIHAGATILGVLNEYIKRSGFSGVVAKTGTGVYVLTLTEPVGPRADGNAMVFVTPGSPAICAALIDAVDGSTVTITCLDAAGVATDVGFLGVTVVRMPVGVGGEV